jgi:DTW domain-containing protein YfiP
MERVSMANKTYEPKIYCSQCGKDIKECKCNRSKKVETKVVKATETK